MRHGCPGRVAQVNPLGDCKAEHAGAVFAQSMGCFQRVVALDRPTYLEHRNGRDHSNRRVAEPGESVQLQAADDFGAIREHPMGLLHIEPAAGHILERSDSWQARLDESLVLRCLLDFRTQRLAILHGVDTADKFGSGLAGQTPRLKVLRRP